MKIHQELLEKLSRLSALKIENPQEKQELIDFLTKALSYFEQIKNIETKNIPPLINPLQTPLRFRSDQALRFPDVDKLLAQAPQKQGNLVKAPSSL